ncbi:MAG: hypothetical protein AVDCRST_MAG21-1226, partial [uncultured Nocardioidaceae bacterium]
GGDEATDGRRSAGGHEGGTRAGDARPARRWWPARGRAQRRGGQVTRGSPQPRHDL